MEITGQEIPDSPGIRRCSPREPGGFTHRFFVIAGGSMLIAVGLCFFYCCDPMQQSVLPPCVFHEMTGWNCIGCGGTRAFHLILHGRILESLRYNLLCIPFLGVFSYIVISLVLRKTRFAIPEIHPGVPGMSVFLVLLFVFMLLRNIPVYPLILLSP